MAVITWIVEGTWPACVDAARGFAPAGAEIVMLHVSGGEAPAAAHGAYAGLLGRGRPGQDPGRRLDELSAASARQLLDAAAERLGRPCTRVQRHGRVEREVVAASEDADLLILARDGDIRLGPRSLGPASRFVVDHARFCWSGPRTPQAPARSPRPPPTSPVPLHLPPTLARTRARLTPVAGELPQASVSHPGDLPATRIGPNQGLFRWLCPGQAALNERATARASR